jgi:hypothetical protein
MEGPGGKTWVPRDRYSLMMSFCVVPGELRDCREPVLSATGLVERESHIAVALIVIDVFISSSGMPSKSARACRRCG